MTVNNGFCGCGCGRKTKMISKTSNERGYAKGEYRTYLHGHNPRPKRDEVSLFWEKLVKKESGCWEWTGSVNSQGYGTLYFQGAFIRAHRLSWVLVNGKIPAGLHILHKCDNPACCNPDHIYPGTDQDNANDRQSRGRLPARRAVGGEA